MTLTDTPTEFQRRRRHAGRVAMPFVVIGVGGSATAAYFAADKAAGQILVVAFITVAIIGAIIGLRIYRCPNCDEVPSEGGILLNPEVCPSCGAALK